MKIEKTNVEDTAKVLNWLVDNVGERLPNSGSNLNGVGWCIRCNTYMDTYIIELTEHVDEETQLIFMLKWA